MAINESNYIIQRLNVKNIFFNCLVYVSNRIAKSIKMFMLKMKLHAFNSIPTASLFYIHPCNFLERTNKITLCIFERNTLKPFFLLKPLDDMSYEKLKELFPL